jgi:energy-converting hydrogenase Eha subunit F
MAMQKAKPEALAVPFTSPEPVPRSAQPFPAPQYAAPQPLASYAAGEVPVPAPGPTMSEQWAFAVDAFRNATSQEHMAKLYETAVGLGFHTDQLATLVGIGKDRLNALA